MKVLFICVVFFLGILIGFYQKGQNKNVYEIEKGFNVYFDCAGNLRSLTVRYILADVQDYYDVIHSFSISNGYLIRHK